MFVPCITTRLSLIIIDHHRAAAPRTCERSSFIKTFICISSGGSRFAYPTGCKVLVRNYLLLVNLSIYVLFYVEFFFIFYFFNGIPSISVSIFAEIFLVERANERIKPIGI